MVIERELYMVTNPEEEICTVMRVTSCHSIRSLPLSLKAAETLRKRSLRVACGRPEATEM
jgi:hypothetical protein